MGDPTSPTVRELTAEQTHDLRRRVLRVDTPSTDVEWPGDHDTATFHLGIVDERGTIAVATWLVAASPDLGTGHAGIQLRGMATDPDERGTGLGASVLRAGIERSARSGADHVWANARSSALEFYTRHGFEITSDEFEPAETAMPHRRILLRF